MKKNLIGIVAAGLALALAFTGCESGSDSPVKYATDLDNPVTKGSKFTYVATPSSYEPAAADKEEVASAGADWASFANGTNSFSRRSTSAQSRGTVTGSDYGDVIKTTKSTIVLNSKDNTFSVLEETTSKEVFELKDGNDDGTVNATSKKIAKAKKVSTIATGKDYAVTPIVCEASGVSGGVIGTSGAVEVTDYKAAADALLGALDAGATAFKNAEYKAEADATKIKAYNDIVKALKEELVLVDALRFGAVKIIVETDAAAKTTTSYLTDKGANAIAPVVATGTAPKAKTGTYKVLSGSYKDGSILVTSFDTETWNDDDGTYVKDGYKGLISEGYPEPSTVAGSTSRKAARTLTISGGKLTFPKITNCTLAAESDPLQKTFAFFQGKGSYASWFDTRTRTGATATAQPEYQSYSYVLKQ